MAGGSGTSLGGVAQAPPTQTKIIHCLENDGGGGVIIICGDSVLRVGYNPCSFVNQLYS